MSLNHLLLSLISKQTNAKADDSNYDLYLSKKYFWYTACLHCLPALPQKPSDHTTASV
jgi:hypothetical protein